MKNRDLKKLALLGITGGIMMVAQSVQADLPQASGHMIAHNCGGEHGCQGVADNYRPYSGNDCSASGGCGGSGQSSYQGYSTCSQNQQSQGYNRNTSNPYYQQNNQNNQQNESYYQPQQQQQQQKQQQQQSYNSRNGRYYTADADEAEKTEAPAKTMTKDELKAQLSDQGKAMFDRLSPEGQALAIKLASQTCKGHNDCKGMNSCKSDKNACGGQGACKGTSTCAFKDKNKAVKVAALKMAEKRASMNSGAGK